MPWRRLKIARMAMKETDLWGRACGRMAGWEDGRMGRRERLRKGRERRRRRGWRWRRRKGEAALQRPDGLSSAN